MTLFVPITIVAICNSCIFWHVRQSSRRIHNIDNNRNNYNISRKRDLHLSKIMLLTFCILIIGWAPILIQQLISNIRSELQTDITSFFSILLSASLLANMILLIYSNQPIRNLICQTLKCNRIIPCVIQY